MSLNVSVLEKIYRSATDITLVCSAFSEMLVGDFCKVGYLSIKQYPSGRVLFHCQEQLLFEGSGADQWLFEDACFDVEKHGEAENVFRYVDKIALSKTKEKHYCHRLQSKICGRYCAVILEIGLVKYDTNKRLDQSIVSKMTHYLPFISHVLKIKESLSCQSADDTRCRSIARFYVSSDSTLRNLNVPASSLLSSADLFIVKKSKLLMSCPTQQQRFHRKIQVLQTQALGSQRYQSSLLGVFSCQHEGQPQHVDYQVNVTPWCLDYSAEVCDQLGYVVIVSRIDSGLSHIQNIDYKKLYGLSSSESKVAGLLCAGKSIEHISQHRGVSLETTRKQVKSILKKSGSHSQVAFVSRSLLLGFGLK